tara:strand:- start:533 stop:793 length:261 start_codon:yes stop_codon:yes gene_type:complete
MKFEKIDRIIAIAFILTLIGIYLIQPSWQMALFVFFIGVYTFTRSLDVQEGTYKTTLKSSTPVAIGWGILNIGLFIVFILELLDKI